MQNPIYGKEEKEERRNNLEGFTLSLHITSLFMVNVPVACSSKLPTKARAWVCEYYLWQPRKSSNIGETQFFLTLFKHT